MAARKSTVAA